MKIFFPLQKKKTEMEELFTREEQESVAHVLYNLSKADYLGHQTENECVNACLAEIGFDDKDFVPVQKNELQSQVYDTIKLMSKDKKRIFSGMMTRVSRSDGDFGARERALVIEILEMCDVPFVHK